MSMTMKKRCLNRWPKCIWSQLKTCSMIPVKTLSPEQEETFRANYSKKTRSQRGFGRKKRKGKGKSESSNPGASLRKRWRPRKKGPKRSQSRTRVYADNKLEKRSSTKRCPTWKIIWSTDVLRGIIRQVLVNRCNLTDLETLLVQKYRPAEY